MGPIEKSNKNVSTDVEKKTVPVESKEEIKGGQKENDGQVESKEIEEKEDIDVQVESKEEISTGMVKKETVKAIDKKVVNNNKKLNTIEKNNKKLINQQKKNNQQLKNILDDIRNTRKT